MGSVRLWFSLGPIVGNNTLNVKWVLPIHLLLFFLPNYAAYHILLNIPRSSKYSFFEDKFQFGNNQKKSSIKGGE